MALIVLADGDPARRGVLAPALRYSGHLVRAVGSTREVLREITEADVDMVILDMDLPDASGATALRAVRRVSNAPMIAITGPSDEGGIVTALRGGADHCMTKPVSAGQLSARVTALLRRTRDESPGAESVLVIGDLRIERHTRTASLGTRLLDLRRLEFDLLAYLAAHAGSVVTRDELFTTSGDARASRTSRPSTCTSVGCAANWAKPPERRGICGPSTESASSCRSSHDRPGVNPS